MFSWMSTRPSQTNHPKISKSSKQFKDLNISKDLNNNSQTHQLHHSHRIPIALHLGVYIVNVLLATQLLKYDHNTLKVDRIGDLFSSSNLLRVIILAIYKLFIILDIDFVSNLTASNKKEYILIQWLSLGKLVRCICVIYLRNAKKQLYYYDLSETEEIYFS